MTTAEAVIVSLGPTVAPWRCPLFGLRGFQGIERSHWERRTQTRDSWKAGMHTGKFQEQMLSPSQMFSYEALHILSRPRKSIAANIQDAKEVPMIAVETHLAETKRWLKPVLAQVSVGYRPWIQGAIPSLGPYLKETQSVLKSSDPTIFTPMSTMFEFTVYMGASLCRCSSVACLVRLPQAR